MNLTKVSDKYNMYFLPFFLPDQCRNLQLYDKHMYALKYIIFFLAHFQFLSNRY
jgi:hypothetical protein